MERAEKTNAPGGHTLAKLFTDSCRANATRPALRWKKNQEWREMDYAELQTRVKHCASALLSWGLKKGDRVALFARNSPEWAITDWADVTTGLVTVPIYDTLTAEKAAYILKDSGAKVVVVQTKDHLDKVRNVRKQLPGLKHVVVIEEMFEKALEETEHLFDDVLKEGAEWAKKHADAWDKARATVKPDDLASIVYTSGPTGEPKGVLLTHNNFASNVISALKSFPIEAGDVALSFLPLSHVFERMAGHFTLLHAGCTIAYAESIEKVPENMLEVRPMVMMSVPRLYEKIYARVHEKVRGGSFLKRYLFGKAVAVGKQYCHEKYTLKVTNPSTERKYKRFDRLVFSKLRERTGGRVKFFVSGGAALSKEIEEFFNAVGLPILQGYGLTETSPVISFNSFHAMRFGAVGKPIEGADVKIAEDGEILVRGPMVMTGYWQKPEATKEAFTKDGYFRTGDIGKVDEDGFLFVTDRKKELIVMSNGKKVAPQPIENDLKTKPGIGQAVVIGNQKNYISALLWPDFEALKKYAQEKGVKFNDQAELLTRDEILKLFEKNVGEVNQGLSRYEQIKRYKLLPTELAPGAPELTPTLKIKRRVVDERYGGQIQELYAGEGKAE
ncbi:MAG: long-chain fatty acid--CoA ligase [Euryarchaeota archaeon]|nr:long-chain fatty acid--CoA ligase [Euryarchaeota archaeon]